MSYRTAGENKVSLSYTNLTSRLRAVHPPCHDRSYIRSRYRTSALWVFKENFIFSPLSAYSPIPRATRNTLKPPSLVYNLLAM
jgi:hypothetical protein